MVTIQSTMAGRRYTPGPGKTTPRLLEDLLDYNPNPNSKLVKTGKNLLADPAWQVTSGLPPPRKLSPHDCRHALMWKNMAKGGSYPLSNDVRPDIHTKYNVETYCSICRYYFQVKISFDSIQAEDEGICHMSEPIGDNPLHHLRLTDSMTGKSWEEKVGAEAFKFEPLLESHRFVCTAQKCPAQVEIRISSPRLPIKLLAPITDVAKLFQRGQLQISKDPVRYDGLTPTSVYNALRHFGHYVEGAKNRLDTEEPKLIAKRNKKYMLTFADECEALFEYVGFTTFEGDVDPELGPTYFWKPPVITNTNRQFINDIIAELHIHMFKLDPKQTLSIPVPALNDLQKSLGCFDYGAKTNAIDLETVEHPYYASLGACENFQDELLGWAYDRQRECDPSNAPYYLDCLKDLANGRGSSDLQTKVVIAESSGEFGLNEIMKAYKFLGIEINTVEGDDHIIGTYRSRVESAPRQKDEARESLLVIAKHRGSAEIEKVAKDKKMSYNEALEFLNVSADTAIDSIEACAVAMSFDADKSRVAEALRVIANNHTGVVFPLRRSAAFMESNSTGSEYDVAEAYNRLQLNNRQAPDETVFMYYRNLAPSGVSAGSKDSYTEALRIIGLDRMSDFLLQKAEDPEAKVEPAPAEPVGIDNIGNTCYLNSLLQYYYTIKPVRTMVLDFEHHRMTVDEEAVRDKKRVGGRVVEKKEIIKAQKFVDELHDLFMELKSSSARSVRPTKELAELTIFSTDKEETFRRKSISSPRGPPPLSMDGVMFGPQGPPPLAQGPLTPEDDIEMIDRPTDKNVDNGDTASDTTLVDVVDTEHMPPLVHINSHKNSIISEVQDFATNKPGQITTESENDLDGDAVMIDGQISPISPGTLTPPQEKPPPIPPRKKSGLVISTNESKPVIVDNDFWRFGVQQDVTEVINNVIDRLRYSVKPTGIDNSSDEQIDVITSTFYGANTTYTQKAQGLDSKREAWSYLTAFPPPDGVARDLYDAIDVGLDQSAVELEQSSSLQYASISTLPPVLQIQVQRTDYSPTKGAFKNRNHVEFPDTIYLDRYMDTKDQDSVVMRRRRENWKWKKELDVLMAREYALRNAEGEIPVGEALHSVNEYIKSLLQEGVEDIEIDPTLPEVLAERIAEVEKELKDVAEQIEVLRKKTKTQFDDLTEFEYKIHSVFIHRGEAGGGHYWVYIHDSEQDVWREYNDENVTTVRDRSRIFADQGINGQPYFVAYVRSKDKKEMVDTVCRQVPTMPVEVPIVTSNENGNGNDIERWDDGNHGGYEKMETSHVEHVSPRPLRPKPAVTMAGDSSQWEKNWPPASSEEAYSVKGPWS